MHEQQTKCVQRTLWVISNPSFQCWVSRGCILASIVHMQASIGARGRGRIPATRAYMDASAGMGSVVKPLNPRVNVPVAALQLMAWTW